MKLLAAVGLLGLLAFGGASVARTSSSAPAPTGLRAFVLRADEPLPARHTYAEMPAFAWEAVPGATSYELQVATSPSFTDSTSVYDDARLAAPVASVSVQVPWLTGSPYALWAHVRARVGGRVSAWSTPFGFNTAWQQVPRPLPAPPGLVRWTPVDGATSYEVWFQDVPGQADVHFSTLTNVADEREYWTFHPGDAAVVHWRVRAVRTTTAATLGNGVPITRYGPYSPVYTSTNATGRAAAPLAAADVVSNVDSGPSGARAQALTPGFAWTGTEGVSGEGASAYLWRVYVFSDRACVNQVMAGSLVGSPAWAPRNADPIALPGTLKDLHDAIAGRLLSFGPQTGATMADGTDVTPAESTLLGAAPAAASSSSSSSASADAPRAVSLPDNGWPKGRYWWTVVPVQVVDTNGDPATVGADSDQLRYVDMELPQDACAAGHVWPFGVQSAPVTTSASTPLVSGLADGTRVVSAATKVPSFQQLPLVTWRPALGATGYEVQVSRRLYPWVARWSRETAVTSAALPLSKRDVGTWYYRVRGIDPDLPAAAQKMAWSKPVALRITGDRFVVVR